MALHTPARSDTRPPRPPGPRLPVLVQTLLFGQYRHKIEPFLRRRYGDVFTVRIAPGRRQLAIITDPDHIRTVFTGPSTVYHAGEGNALLGPIMGEHSLLLVDEDDHRRTRKLLMPAFHGPALRGYQDLIENLAVAEVERWPTDRVFRAHDRMHVLTLEIILQVVFGVTDPARLDALRPLVRRIAAIGPLVMLGWWYPALRSYGPWKRYATIQADLDRLLYAEIAGRRAAADLDRRNDVLSRLLRETGDNPPAGDGSAADNPQAGNTAGGDGTAGGAPDGLTDAELRDQLVTLLLAGHETTATTLAWALHELARRPALLRRAQRAADENDEAYLGAVVKETLRLRPVIYEVARKLTEPVDIGGYRLPAGAVAAPTIGLVQSDAQHHPDPTEFRPERFLKTQPAANTWIPFGGGARRCIGAGFSLVEATVVLREALRRYDIRPDRSRPETQRARNITFVPARGARVAVSRRTDVVTGG